MHVALGKQISMAGPMASKQKWSRTPVLTLMTMITSILPFLSFILSYETKCNTGSESY